MDEYTPTTEQVEDAYSHDPESEYRDPVNYPSLVSSNRRAFRRWLKNHERLIAQDARAKGYARAMADWEAENE